MSREEKDKLLGSTTTEPPADGVAMRRSSQAGSDVELQAQQSVEATPRLHAAPQTPRKRRDKVRVQYGDCITDRAHTWLSNVCCSPCRAAEAKANLDGRDCTCCDCLCGLWPFDQLYPRRQLRMKYNLAFDRPAKCCNPSWWDDFWVPMMMMTINMCIPTCISAVFTSNTAWVFGSNLFCATWITCFPCTRITRMEAVRRSHGVLSYGSKYPTVTRSTITPSRTVGETYHTSLFGCLMDTPMCCCVTCLPPCALGEAGALVQGRRADCLDYCSFPTPWQLRKSVMSKYGMSQDHTCEDCLIVTACAPCAVCQDFRELKIRHSEKGYLPWDAHEGYFYLPHRLEHDGRPKMHCLVPPRDQTVATSDEEEPPTTRTESEMLVPETTPRDAGADAGKYGSI